MKKILLPALTIFTFYHSMAKEIRTEIIIQASPEKVWSVLTDFANYPAWNPFIVRIAGDLRVHKKISVTLSPPDSKNMSFKPRLLSINQNNRLVWFGHLLMPGLFDGRHIFELIDNHDGSTTFIQREIFKGALVVFFKKKLDNNTRKGFELMNKSLKAVCEGR